VIFGKEVAVLATQIAAVGDVDRADGKLRQAKHEKFGHVAQLCKFPSNVHCSLFSHKKAQKAQDKYKSRTFNPILFGDSGAFCG
jgi:hypothetical protein